MSFCGGRSRGDSISGGHVQFSVQNGQLLLLFYKQLAWAAMAVHQFESPAASLVMVKLYAMRWSRRRVQLEF